MYPSRPTHSASKTHERRDRGCCQAGQDWHRPVCNREPEESPSGARRGAQAGKHYLVSLQTERAQVAAKGRQAETEAAPIRYVAEMLGADTDSERTIRWLIALNRGASHSRTKHGWTCLGATRSCIRACSGTDPRQTSRALRRWRSFVGLLKGRAKVDKPLHRHQRALGFQQCELV